jgi:hypothetical protein
MKDPIAIRASKGDLPVVNYYVDAPYDAKRGFYSVAELKEREFYKANATVNCKECVAWPIKHIKSPERFCEECQTRVGYREAEPGWTITMIRTMLLKEDRIRLPVRRRTRPRGSAIVFYRCAPMEYEYSLAQVTAVEATPEWQKAKRRANRKLERGPVPIRIYPTSPLKFP